MPSSIHRKTVAISGAGGQIGRAVVAHLLNCGYDISALVHSPRAVTFDNPHVNWVVGDVRDPVAVGRFVADADILVHLAARKSDERDSEEINIRGTKNLVDACEAAGVGGIINVSTISTKLKTAGRYGRTKREADRVIAASALPSRTLLLSVVYDDAGGGIFGTLIRYARLPAIPVFGSGEITFRPIHVDDVAQAIALIISAPMIGHRTYELGGPDRVSFNSLAMMVGQKVRSAEPRLVHLPLPLGRLLATLLSVLFAKPPITTSNVLGMGEDLEVDSGPFMRDYGFYPRTLAIGIDALAQRERSRGDRISDDHLEAFALCTYLSGDTPTETDIAAYEAAATHFGLTDHRISSVLLRSTLLIGAFDAITKLTRPRGVFQRKILVAAALYECTPRSSEKLLPRALNAGDLARSGVLIAVRTIGKLLLGLLLVCVPGFYKRNA